MDEKQIPHRVQNDRASTLAANHDDREAAGSDGWTWMRVGGCRLGARPKLRADHVNAVGGGVVGHGGGAALGGQGSKRRVAGGASVDHGENSLTAGGEGQLVGRIVVGRVGAVGG